MREPGKKDEGTPQRKVDPKEGTYIASIDRIAKFRKLRDCLSTD